MTVIAENIELYLLKRVEKKLTNTGKSFPDITGHLAVNGYATQKLVGFESKKNPGIYVLKQSADEEDTPVFFLREKTFDSGKTIISCNGGKDAEGTSIDGLSVYGLNFPVTGNLGSPIKNKYGDAMIPITMELDLKTVEYYKSEYTGSNPKEFNLVDDSVEPSNAVLLASEANLFPEFVELKDTVFDVVEGEVEVKKTKEPSKAKDSNKDEAGF